MHSQLPRFLVGNIYDIVLLAPTVTSLQQLLHVCETELAWLDMSINVKKSSCLRIGPRYNSFCSNLTTLDGREIMWMNKVHAVFGCLLSLVKSVKL